METDLSSAFQRASREDILGALFEYEPLRPLIPLFNSLYGLASRLFFDEVADLLSEEGSQQGCPLGGLWRRSIKFLSLTPGIRVSQVQ